MSHEIAKLLLEHANTFLERTEAIKSAMSLGMPLNEIEEYLDWLSGMQSRSNGPPGERPASNEAQTERDAGEPG